MVRAVGRDLASDIKLTVEGQSIPAHKIFLKIRAPKLYSSIENLTLFEIVNFTHEEVMDFLKFCYAGIIPKLEPNFLKLVATFCDNENVDLFEDLMQNAHFSARHVVRLKIIGKFWKKFRKDMAVIKEDKSLTDLKFFVEGKVIPVHKIVMYARSEYFEKLMSSGMKESRQSEVKLQDASWDAMEKFFEYVYIGHISDLTGDDAVSLLCHCHFFMDERLLSICQNLVTEALEIDNVVDLFLVAKDVSLTKLLFASREFLFHHFDELLRHTSMKNLPFEDLEKLYLAKDPSNASIFAKQKKIWDLNQSPYNPQSKLVMVEASEESQGKQEEHDRQSPHKPKPKKNKDKHKQRK
jgi:hypothetical protein